MNSFRRSLVFGVFLAAGLCLTVAARQQPAPAAARGAAATPEAPLKMEFVKIPAGDFMMGCSMGDTMCDAPAAYFKGLGLDTNVKETPAHMVKITKPFEIGKYVVTQYQWQMVMGSPSPSTFQKGDNYPAENISWIQVQDFLTKINSMNDGFKYRLPTEAEWEYAARAGTTGPTTGELDAVAWYDQKGGPSTRPVGKKAPNAWGLYDVQGNVWQYVQDSYSDYKKNAVIDPVNTKGDVKVLRGGSWDMPASVARVSSRLALPPNFKNNNTGFRLVREMK
jgi:formylglycine-generating enzyme required for sulfatase activity